MTRTLYQPNDYCLKHGHRWRRRHDIAYQHGAWRRFFQCDNCGSIAAIPLGQHDPGPTDTPPGTQEPPQ